MQSGNKRCRRTFSGEHQTLRRDIHITVAAWRVHHFQFASCVEGKRLFAIHIAHLHFSNAGFVGTGKISGIIEGNGIIGGAIGVDTANFCLPIRPHHRATESNATDIRHLVGIDGVLYFRAIQSSINHALRHRRRDGSTHHRFATHGGARGIPEVAVHAHKVALTGFRLTDTHLRNGFAARHFIGAAHRADFDIGIIQIHCGVEHPQMLQSALQQK